MIQEETTNAQITQINKLLFDQVNEYKPEETHPKWESYNSYLICKPPKNIMYSFNDLKPQIEEYHRLKTITKDYNIIKQKPINNPNISVIYKYMNLSTGEYYYGYTNYNLYISILLTMSNCRLYKNDVYAINVFLNNPDNDYKLYYGELIEYIIGTNSQIQERKGILANINKSDNLTKTFLECINEKPQIITKKVKVKKTDIDKPKKDKLPMLINKLEKNDIIDIDDRYNYIKNIYEKLRTDRNIPNDIRYKNGKIYRIINMTTKQIVYVGCTILTLASERRYYENHKVTDKTIKYKIERVENHNSGCDILLQLRRDYYIKKNNINIPSDDILKESDMLYNNILSTKEYTFLNRIITARLNKMEMEHMLKNQVFNIDDNNNYVIYNIKNTTDNKIYIGYTKPHISNQIMNMYDGCINRICTKKLAKTNKLFYALLYVSPSIFTVSIIRQIKNNANMNKLVEKEIVKYDSIKNGYNKDKLIRRIYQIKK